VIEEANEALREKGYSSGQLVVVAAPLPGHALLKGTKILSPFADSPEVVFRAVRDCVPPADQLGRRQLRPHDLRNCLADDAA
jgi:hypothetical protein